MSATDSNEQALLSAKAEPSNGSDDEASSPAMETGAAAAWSMPTTLGHGTDPILDCLVQLSSCLERPCSAPALIAGLPLIDDRLTPALSVRALEGAGFAAVLAKRSLDQIAKPLLPCLLFLKEQKACLLLALDGGDAVISLPETAGGEVRLARSDLEHDMTGYVLFAKPSRSTPDVMPDHEAASTRHWFWGVIAEAWPVYAEVALAALMINLFALASPLFVMNVYDRVVPNQAIETLWALSLGVVIVFLFDFVLRTLRGYFVDTAGKAADVKIASRIFAQVLGIRMAAKPGSSGAFANNLREFETLRDFFTSATLVALIDLPFVILFVAIVWLIGGPIAIVPAIAIPIVLCTGLLVQWPLRHATQATFKEAAQKHGLLIECINGLETIRASGAEGRTQRRWEQAVDATAHSTSKARFFATIGVNVAALAQNLTTVGIVIFGVHQIGEGLLTVGALVACTIISGRAMAPLGQVAGILTRYHQARAAYQALTAMMALPVERPIDKRFLHRPKIAGGITFNTVRFCYPGESIPALDGVSFRLDAGERVGLIGRVGSGKTTVEKLLLNFFEPDEGSILLDGTDLRQIDPVDLRRHVGAVLQDVTLFQGSLRDNMTLGAGDVDDDLVLSVAKLAGVDAFAARHPLGYDMMVGERGSQLSGGQRQAVAVARALIHDPPILLFDEPTSAMDNSSENRFKRQLESILPNKTLLLVTHRTSLLSLVQRLIVMDGGRIVADGPKDDVLHALAAGKIRGVA
ncbi:MAG: type I secretion system permease/ATPase [Pseudomonadota bacterium]